MNQDLEHLRLLTIFHYVVAGMIALFACIPFIHFFIGLALATGAIGGKDPGAGAIGLIFAFFGGIFILAGWTLAALVFFSGRNLAARTRYLYCLVMSGVMCLFMPVGTVLGVFTIIVLMRDSVKTLFGQPAAAVQQPPAPGSP